MIFDVKLEFLGGLFLDNFVVAANQIALPMNDDDGDDGQAMMILMNEGSTNWGQQPK